MLRRQHVFISANQRVARSRVSGAPGFSLVATLSVMLCLALVTLALLQMSVVEVRSSAHDDYRQVARSNARMALMVALGELQKYAGPDQVVTGRSDMLDMRSLSALDEQVDPELDHARYSVVWPTTAVGEGPYDYQHAKYGNGVFLRKVAHAGAVLVSGNERYDLNHFQPQKGEDYPEGYVTAHDPIEGEWVELAGRSAEKDEDRVRVPLVDVHAGPGKTGSYAYWVSDNGVKARINLRDRDRPSNQSLVAGGDGTRGDFNAVLAPASYDLLSLGEDLLDSEHLSEHARKYISVSSLELASDSLREHLKKRFPHDLTADSYGLLTDVKLGGLKKNLTSAVNVDDAEFQDLIAHEGDEQEHRDNPVFLFKNWSFPLDPDANGSANVSFRNYPGTPWEVYRAYVRGGEESFEPELVGQAPVPVMSQYANTLESGDSRPHLFEQGMSNSKMKARLLRRSPVLLRAQIAIDYSVSQPIVVKDSSAQGGAESDYWEFYLRMHFMPLFVFWNPYNVTMTSAGQGHYSYYTNRDWGTGDLSTPVHFHFPQNRSWKAYRYKEGYGKGVVGSGDFVGGKRLFYPYANSSYRYAITSMAFQIPRYTLEPGASVVFGLTENREQKSGRVSQALTALTDISESVGRSVYMKHMKIRVKKLPGESMEDMLPEIDLGGFRNSGDLGRLTSGNTPGFERVNWLWQHVVNASNVPSFTPTIVDDGQRLPVADANGTESPKYAGVVIRKMADTSRYFGEEMGDSFGSGHTAGSYGGQSSNRYLAPWMALYNGAGSRQGVYKGFNAPFLYLSAIACGRGLFDLVQPDMTADAQVYVGYDDTVTGGVSKSVLYPVRRRELRIMSLGHFRHLDVGKIMNSLTNDMSHSASTDSLMPMNAIGNAMASPHLPLNKTSLAMWDGKSYVPPFNIYDHSFRYNEALWDRYFLTGQESGESFDGVDEFQQKVANRSLRPVGEIDAELMNDVHQSAGHVLVDGAFNINSTSVEAWKAFLSSTRGLLSSPGDVISDDLVGFPRGMYVNAQADAQQPVEVKDRRYYSGAVYRALTMEEIESLAEHMVRQVKLRGPFCSLSQFVNRSLSTDLQYRKSVLGASVDPDAVLYAGTVQSAIDATDINGVFNQSNAEIPDAQLGSEWNESDYLNGKVNAKAIRHHSAYGTPGTLTQADVLARLGHLMTARSDTFTIRSYGDARNGKGQIVAKAYCEAIVQRGLDYVDASDDSSEMAHRWQWSSPEDGSGKWSQNEDLSELNRRLGRRFQVMRFRWLSEDEI
ncbi:hypothetical protein HW115_10695 [Verrucomicrobiaceae bacterium N1E253]|uniref:Uncharacterized protein n=1 Tax=Oceaniferula marina TaxID=2748318 RepID=A0A851GFU7_9BACT|nr:hypothetical protein [Oceaniferula marina]NWK56079.1 hypothetical protein [Oceaniferula marina]